MGRFTSTLGINGQLLATARTASYKALREASTCPRKKRKKNPKKKEGDGEKEERILARAFLGERGDIRGATSNGGIRIKTEEGIEGFR